MSLASLHDSQRRAANLARAHWVEWRMQRETDARREEVARPKAAEVKSAFACRRCGYGIVAFVTRLPRCPMCGSRTTWRELGRRP